MRKSPQSIQGIVAGMLLGLAILIPFHFTSWAKETNGSPPDINVDATPLKRDTRGINSFAPIVKKAAPSVVNIYSTHIVHMRPYRNPFENDPFFRQFFGDQFQGGGQDLTRREESLGSGVIVSPDGYILTANHVVAGADEIKVSIAGNKKEYPAKVVGTDPPTDVAVLKIDASDLPAITLGDSDQLEVGDIVLAIGNPFGIGQTVTMGIVSALGRNGLPFSGNNYSYEDFIQTDAAINPGNSGGALVDAEGRLVGINTAIISSSRGNEGVGLAVPISMAREVMNHLISGGSVPRGYLGIMPQDINSRLQEAFNLPSQNGALVGDVEPGTPANKAGLQDGDVIVAVNGKPVDDAHALQLIISQKAPGSKVTIKYVRDGKTKTTDVTLAELPNAVAQNGSNGSTSSSSTTDALDGVTVDNLNQNVRQQLNIPDNIHGAIVTDVDPNSNAADAGLQQSDVIIAINHHAVSSADDAVKLATEAGGKQILLKIWRRSDHLSGTRYLSVDNTKKKEQ